MPTNLSASTLMTYSRILTSAARTGMHASEDALMNTSGPTWSPTANLRDFQGGIGAGIFDDMFEDMERMFVD